MTRAPFLKQNIANLLKGGDFVSLENSGEENGLNIDVRYVLVGIFGTDYIVTLSPICFRRLSKIARSATHICGTTWVQSFFAVGNMLYDHLTLVYGLLFDLDC